MGAEKHDGQHGQIEKDHSYSADLGEIVRGVVPAPDAGAPTDQNSSGELTPRFWDEPQCQHVVKPALRDDGHQKEKAGVVGAITEQSQGEQRAREDEQGEESRILMEATDP